MRIVMHHSAFRNALTKRSSGAVASAVTGALGLFVFPLSIVAVVLGHGARAEIRKSDGRLTGATAALVGLILGYVGIAIIPIVVVAAAIVVPNLLRARIAANQLSALLAIGQINKGEISYQALLPQLGYTCSLATLGETSVNSPTGEHAALVDADLARGEKNGYLFELRHCVVSGGRTLHYEVVAYPKKLNGTGIEAYCSNELGTVKSDARGLPDSCERNGMPIK
jgi:type IV pilus assembly protein PilA